METQQKHWNAFAQIQPNSGPANMLPKTFSTQNYTRSDWIIPDTQSGGKARRVSVARCHFLPVLPHLRSKVCTMSSFPAVACFLLICLLCACICFVMWWWLTRRYFHFDFADWREKPHILTVFVGAHCGSITLLHRILTWESEVSMTFCEFTDEILQDFLYQAFFLALQGAKSWTQRLSQGEMFCVTVMCFF